MSSPKVVLCAALLVALHAPSLRAAEPESALVADFLAAAKTSVRSAQDLPALAARLRPLHTALDEALARRTNLSERKRAAARARDELSTGLSALLPGDAARASIDDLLEEAGRTHRNRRLAALEASIMCWCPDEKWTRTLSGCPEPCANPQKSLLRSWIEEGATDAEIVDRMVAHPNGGPRVRAAPEAQGVSWIGYLAPAAIFVVALVLLTVFLRRVARRAPDETSASAAPAPALDDDSVGEQVERELKEMEG